MGQITALVPAEETEGALRLGKWWERLVPGFDQLAQIATLGERVHGIG